MGEALAVTGRALRLWWGEVFVLIFFNLAWLALQAPIVTGPPATAAMYLVARQVADGESIGPRTGLEAFRRMLLPGLQWGLLNLPVLLAVIGNFWLYHESLGLGWTILRLLWGVIALGWVAVNIFYWPFWLAQDRPAVRATLLNGLLILVKRPVFALAIVVLSLVVIVLGGLLTLPLATASMSWAALIGVLAIDQELHRVKAARAADIESPSNLEKSA